MEKNELLQTCEKYCAKLRISPFWDVKLQFVEDAGDNRELSFGRCGRQSSFNELYEELSNLE